MAKNEISLAKWAKQNNLAYKTAWRRFKAGQLPCRAVQFSTGTILVYPEEPAQIGGGRVVIYARVTPLEGKNNLEMQLDRLRSFAAARGLCIDEEFSDIGFGMDGSCEELRVLLEEPSATTIIVEHFDRLSWLGRECVESLLKSSGKNLLEINKFPNKMSLQDLDAHVIALYELYLGVEIPEMEELDKFLLQYSLDKKLDKVQYLDPVRPPIVLPHLPGKAKCQGLDVKAIHVDKLQKAANKTSRTLRHLLKDKNHPLGQISQIVKNWEAFKLKQLSDREDQVKVPETPEANS